MSYFRARCNPYGVRLSHGRDVVLPDGAEGFSKVDLFQFEDISENDTDIVFAAP
jgi:hypothetical protein